MGHFNKMLFRVVFFVQAQFTSSSTSSFLFFLTFMDIITREKAICMLYCEPYSKARAIELINGIEKIGLDVCYRDDPTEPFLYPSANFSHSGQHLYPILLKKSKQKQYTLFKESL